ncbi:MAG: AAA family ATPase [Clostridia bacterium]|nr:AAA family ATPase [Clostridia bacterium]MBR1653721.1 AAA family ATPase [Clostridia bacterium]
MTKEEYLKELNKAFGDFKFFERDHHYEYKGQRVGISVTRLIEDYTNEFDSQAVAERIAERDNRSVQEVLDEWETKNITACEKGHLGHLYTQSLWNKENVLGEIKNASEAVKILLEPILRQANNFYNDYKDRLEHLADEFVVGSEEYDIASAIDHLFINKLTGGLVLVDYKTNSDIHKNERYAKNMKVPLTHLKDFTLNHYYIQLSIYKYLVEKYTNLKIEEMFIVYFSENIENYEIIEIPYLEKEVKNILENRRVKNMNSVPVLLIGQSGSGKSTSLRNFKGDEVAVVNVLGKPLPFKSDIKAGKCDNYEVILKAIKETKKKTIVIDDANYLITSEFMNKASVKGFDKYNELANNFWNLINGIKNIEGGKTVYLIMHEDTDENGNIKPKTIGKLLDDKVNIQGMFTICIRSMYENGNYIFRLKTNGQDCVKTPFGMFENDTMENDLKAFDKVVREYYELDKELTNEEA